MPSLSIVAPLQSFNSDAHRFILLADEDPEAMDQTQTQPKSKLFEGVPTAISRADSLAPSTYYVSYSKYAWDILAR